MFNKHVTKELSAYCHGELSIEDSRRVAEHLLKCQQCRKEFEEIKLGVTLAGHLQRVAAPASMWKEIEKEWESGEKERHGEGETRRRGGSRRVAHSPRRRVTFILPSLRFLIPALTAVLLLVVGGVVWYTTQSPTASWEVVRLEGAPKVGSDRIGETGRLAVGEWLETDDSSRAKISVGNIGEVEVEPNTRIRLLEAHLTDHRLALARGTMHATIWAPPRLFFVETPSAVAVDLGCAYTLVVDDAGRSFLHVTSGWVALVRDGRESMVPAGAVCQTNPSVGPGTPYFVDASEALQKALAKLDFESGSAEALGTVLAEARPYDTLTLWHLLPRVNLTQRGLVHDRLAEIIPPPKGIDREGIIALDEKMLNLWREELESYWLREDIPIWRKSWREAWKHLRG